MFDKPPHFPIALADEANDTEVRRIVAAHASEQRALPNAAAAENPDALPLAAGQQTVDGSNTGNKRLGDMFPLERTWRRPEEIVCAFDLEGWAAVDRVPEAVEHAAEQRRPYADPSRFRVPDNGVSEL
jgi:hypothetical protein